MISIIVPVYNVEKYLSRCLDSILAQTYTDYELILVDDGSTDTSGALVDEYALKDSRIRAFHGENKGLSGARNRGLDNAKGEYICFVDSDDWIEPTYLKELYDLIEDRQADLAICGYKKNNGDICIIQPDEENVTEETGVDAIDNLYGAGCLQYIVAWNKLYKKELFDGVRFPMGMIHEDEVICTQILVRAGKVVRTDRILYNYRVNNDASIMSVGYSLKRLDIIKAIEIRMDLYRKENLRKYYEKDSFKYLYKILLNIVEIKKLPGDNSAVLSELRKKYWGKYRESLGFGWSIKRKIGMFFFGLVPKAYLIRYRKAED